MGHKVLMSMLSICLWALPAFSWKSVMTTNKTTQSLEIATIRKNTPTNHFDLIIYGGGPQAVAAALKASIVTNDKSKILMIVPDSQLGSLWTSGKQNIIDYAGDFIPSKFPPSLPKGYTLPQGGSISDFTMAETRAFSPEEMAKYLHNEVSQHPNIEVQTLSEIRNIDVEPVLKCYKIDSLTIEKLKKEDGHFIFDDSTNSIVDADLYIDASESGRLVRLSHFVGFEGRSDQDPSSPDTDQMAATLMFEIKGLDWTAEFADGKKPIEAKDIHSSFTPRGSLSFWSDRSIVNTPEVKNWNARHPGMLIKPFNGAEDDDSKPNGNTSFWMNLLLIYHVDATKEWADQVANDGFYPTNDKLDPDTARQMAIDEIKKPEFLHALRSIKGLEHAQLVMQNNEPVVADELYVRESIHTANSVDPTSFALDFSHVNGNDASYFNHRIGLGFYNFDNNSYKKGEILRNPLPKSAWYIPYETLLSPYLTNVLIPGYAANMDSMTWTAMRVYPNLTVLGDAAGGAAGLALEGRFDITNPSEAEMNGLQNFLFEQHAILEK